MIACALRAARSSRHLVIRCGWQLCKYRRTGSFRRLPGRLQGTIQVRLFPVALYALHFVNWIGTNMPRESKGTAT